MKKNIVIGIVSIISVSSLAFGFYQRRVAQEARVLALESEVKALEMKRQIEQARTIAELQTREAMRQRDAVVIANRNLEEALTQLKKTK